MLLLEQSCWVKSLRVLALLFGMGLVMARVAQGADEIKMLRDSNLELYPVFELHNSDKKEIKVKIESSLETADGTQKPSKVETYDVRSGETRRMPAFATEKALTGNIALVRSVITQGDLPAQTFSAVCGSPRPVPRKGDYLVGMNIHLERFTAEEQWRLLQMMKAAGVTSVRLEPGFQVPNEKGEYPVRKVEPVLLASEAFGMSPLMAMTFFPKGFDRASNKAQMAYDWAKAMGEYYKGRAYAWQYGNEANSGWGCYGDAADMVVHNQAMALGSLAADSENLPATFGVAEALPQYLKEMFRLGLSPYLKAVTLHPYGGTAESGIAKLLENRRVIGEYGGNQEIWATEVGFHYAPTGALNPTTQQLTQVNGFSLEQQADGLARLFLLARAKGIERIYWYDFFAKKDRETFWIVDENFKPRPAYDTLKIVGNLIKGAVSLGGTEPTEPIQKQLFRRSDGSVFLAAWALRDGIECDLHLPPGQYSARDTSGKSVAFNLGSPIKLGERPIIIDGLPRTTEPYLFQEILANALDLRSWREPEHRWQSNAGDTVNVPYVAYNPTNAPVKIYPALLKAYPGWEIKLPAPFTVAAGKTATQNIAVTIPRTIVPGVEYRLTFAGETAGPRRTTPYEARIWINGRFPYERLLQEDRAQVDYPVRRTIEEHRVGFGREEISARHATATVDGDLSEWEPSDFVTLDQVGNWQLRDSGQPKREEWFCRVGLRWDEKNLYAAFIILDDDLNEQDMISRDWRDSDNVRLFLSTEEKSKRAKNITAKDFLIFMAPTRQFQNEGPAVMAASLGGFVHTGLEAQIKIESRIWNGGYLIEAAIPFSALNIEPKADLILGCNVLGDDSYHGYRRYAGMTRLTDMSYWNNPQTLGSLRLKP